MKKFKKMFDFRGVIVCLSAHLHIRRRFLPFVCCMFKCLGAVLLTFVSLCFMPVTVYAAWDNSTSIECSFGGGANVNLGTIENSFSKVKAQVNNWGGDCYSRRKIDNFAGANEGARRAVFCLAVQNEQNNGEYYLINSRDEKYRIPVKFFQKNDNSPIGSQMQGRPLMLVSAETVKNFEDGSYRIPLNWDVVTEILPINKILPEGTYSKTFFVEVSGGIDDGSGGWNIGDSSICNTLPKLSPIKVTVVLNALPFCSINTNKSGGLIDFGVVSNLYSVPVQHAMFETQCGGVLKFVAISLGQNNEDGTDSGRRMKRRDGPDYINYNLYRDAARTKLWSSKEPDDSGISYDETCDSGRDPITNLLSCRYNIYAEVPPQSMKPAGVYEDTVIISVRPDPCGC